MHFNMRWRSKK